MPTTKPYEVDIILGLGGFFIGDNCFGLTRGGGQFTVERTYRKIAADGDPGGVKGRINLDDSVPKLTTNLLQIINPNILQLYPAVKNELNENGSTAKMTGSMEIDDEKDYIPEIKWVGRTKKGKPIIITLKNAINLNNIDWSMVEKNEVIQAITWEGTYPEDFNGVSHLLENEKIEEPWSIEYPAPDSVKQILASTSTTNNT